MPLSWYKDGDEWKAYINKAVWRLWKAPCDETWKLWLLFPYDDQFLILGGHRDNPIPSVKAGKKLAQSLTDALLIIEEGE